MALPKGLIKQATGTVAPRQKEEELSKTHSDQALSTIDQSIETTWATEATLPPALSFPILEPSQQRTHDTKHTEGPRPKARRSITKKRVHYYIHADLIEFVENAWRDYRRADGTRLDCASDYIGELLKLARERVEGK